MTSFKKTAKQPKRDAVRELTGIEAQAVGGGCPGMARPPYQPPPRLN